jgi:hypothetical protein
MMSHHATAHSTQGPHAEEATTLITMCTRCGKREAHPLTLDHTCEVCDDLPQLNAFALETFHVGDVDHDRTTRDLLDTRIPWAARHNTG